MNKFLNISLFIVLLLSIPSLLSAQKKENIFAAVGTPANPKVTVVWNRYYDYKGLEDICRQLAKAHPDIISMQSIGKSYEGRDLWVLTISDKKTALKPTQKPALYVDANIHGNESQTSEFVLYLAWLLAETHANGNNFITELLKQKTFYLLPCINPDGRESFIYKANNRHSSRTGNIPVDNDRDGLTDEDGYDDLDGDGHITTMRRKSVYGKYVEDPTDPRRLIKAPEGQKGVYELLGWEGYDNDGDDLINEDGTGGYDPNRDWGWGWQPNYIQRGAYKYPFSLPETRAIAEFIINNRNIGVSQLVHNHGGVFLRGAGSKDDVSSYPAQDMAIYEKLGKKGTELMPGYRATSTYEGMYNVYGGQGSWFNSVRGVFSITNELWNNKFLYNNEDVEDKDAELYHADKHLFFEDAFVSWKPYKHPQYGDVEIGGFKKTYRRLHPGFLIEAESHRHAAYSVFIASQLAQVQVDSVLVEAIGNGLHTVTAIVVNNGTLPTHSYNDVTNKIEVADIISIDGATVLSGMIVNDEDFNHVSEQKNNPAALKVRNIPGNGLVKVRWIVKNPGKITVTAQSKKGGISTKAVYK